MWQTFVGNRVSQIQHKLSAESWKRATSQDNPADIASRDTAKALLTNELS